MRKEQFLYYTWKTTLLSRLFISGLLIASHILHGSFSESALAQEVRVIGVEVSQGIQAFTIHNAGILSLNKPVPLIKGRVTLVRVYLDTSSSWGLFTGSVWVSPKNGPGIVLSALLPSVPIIPPHHIERDSLASRLDFLLPSELTGGDGLIVSTLTLFPFPQTIRSPLQPNPSAPSCIGCDFTVDVSLRDSPPLRVRLVGIDYQKGNVVYGTLPSLDDDLLRRIQIASWLRRAYPVSPTLLEVTSSFETINFSSLKGYENVDYLTENAICEITNAYLGRIVRPRDLLAQPTNVDLHRTHYIGLVYDGTDLGATPQKIAPLFKHGCSDPPFTDSMPAPWDPERYFEKTASAPTGPKGPPQPPWYGELGDGTPAPGYWDTDGEYGDWYVGHELGHLLGLEHVKELDSDPNVCHSLPDTPPQGYPFPNGQLSDVDGTYAGLDTHMTYPLGALLTILTPSPGGMRSLPGQWWHDIMTYCVRQWVSSVSYRHIYCRLFAENGLRGPKPCYDIYLPRIPLFLFKAEDEVPYDVRLAPLPHAKPLLTDVGKPILTPPDGPLKSGPTPSEVNPKDSVPHLTVLASINLKTGHGDLRIATVFGNPPLGTEKTDSRVQLRLTYINGSPKDYTFEVPSSNGDFIANGSRQWATVSVPFRPKPVKIGLVVSGTVVDEMPVTDLPAQLGNFGFKISAKGVESRDGFKQKRVVFSWDFKLHQPLPPGQHVYFVVEWSFDGGTRWNTVAVVGDSEFEVPLERLEKVHGVMLRVTASNGFDEITETSNPLNLFLDKDPVRS